MLEELREFCEDNNQLPPAPMKRVPALRELNHWTAADPALETEAAPGVRLEVARHGGPRGAFVRAIVLQRVVYDLRYALLEGSRPVERVREIGSVSDLSSALAVARAWLEGADLAELPSQRLPMA